MNAEQFRNFFDGPVPGVEDVGITDLFPKPCLWPQYPDQPARPDKKPETHQPVEPAPLLEKGAGPKVVCDGTPRNGFSR
tara:strand:- start:794 stop:1030 length:237 start_codon:yes stop_codon:yes gene_type:complete